MPLPNAKVIGDPVGPLRGRKTVTIGSEDVEFDAGVIVQAATAGDLVYHPLYGGSDITETVAVGDFPNVAGIPVLVSAIRGSSTVTEVVIGLL